MQKKETKMGWVFGGLGLFVITFSVCVFGIVRHQQRLLKEQDERNDRIRRELLNENRKMSRERMKA
jgi:hypothetical protein